MEGIFKFIVVVNKILIQKEIGEMLTQFKQAEIL